MSIVDGLGGVVPFQIYAGLFLGFIMAIAGFILIIAIKGAR